jgi:hypothetical protein
MQAALKLTTRVLPGSRIEFTAPELIEGDEVEVFVALPRSTSNPPTRVFSSAAEYLDSLAPISRSLEEWAEIEREIQQEKSAWDR